MTWVGGDGCGHVALVDPDIGMGLLQRRVHLLDPERHVVVVEDVLPPGVMNT